MTIIIDIEDTVTIHRPVGEDTCFLGVQDMPTPPRRPVAGHRRRAGRAAFGLAATSTGEQPIVFYASYTGRHRKPEPLPTITPVEVIAPSVPPRLTLIGRVRRLLGGAR